MIKYLIILIAVVMSGCTLREDYELNHDQTVDQCVRNAIYDQCIKSGNGDNFTCEDTSIKQAIRLREVVEPNCRFD
jgi:hypothetical protein